ncbi:MAG: hypothetical protein ACK4RK_12030 [Gemmataceae bacterium]
MGTFRHVADTEAGAAALGILVPPGRRTIVILRPRSLPWDLLLARQPLLLDVKPSFQEMDAARAARVAEQLGAALETGQQRVEPLAAAESVGYWLRVDARAFVLIACERRPGQAYQLAVFATLAEAQTAAQQLASVLCPATDAEQEIYFNTRHFTRSS